MHVPLWVGNLLYDHLVPQTRILPGMVLYGQLADLTNSDKLFAYPSAKYLANQQHVSVRTIWRCVADLEDLTLIEKTSPEGRGEKSNDEDADEVISMGRYHVRAETGTNDPDEPDPSKMARRTSTATFRVPLSADVRLGDRIEWNGVPYHVSDTWSKRIHRVVETVRA